MTAPDRYDRRDDPDWEWPEHEDHDPAEWEPPADWVRWGLRAVRDLNVRGELL